MYVADRYEGIEARTFAECSDEEIERLRRRQRRRRARGRARCVRPDVALANHLVMGPVILARALARRGALRGEGPRQRARVHRQARARALPAASRARARAARAACSSAPATPPRACGRRSATRRCRARTRLGPAGRGRRALRAARAAPRPRRGCARSPRGCGARRGARRRRASRRARSRATTRAAGRGARRAWTRRATALVAFVGKLIVSKGVDLLLAAWPLVLERVPARAARGGRLRRLPRRRSSGCVARARARATSSGRSEIARAGRALEADGRRARRRAAAPPARVPRRAATATSASATSRRPRALGERVVFTGRLEHEELAELLPACEALVVPSTFPEAFGMVAAEAAACGALPVSAAPLGAGRGQRGARRARCPREAARWLSFPVDDGAVRALAERVVGWLEADPELRAQTRAGLVATVRERWSWEGVARGVIAAARGELERPAEALNGGRGVARAGVEAPARSDSVPPAHELHAQLHRLRLALRGALAAAARARRSPLLAALALGAAGCSVKGADNANLIAGKQAFVAKCGSCHTLARAEHQGHRRARTSTKPSARASPKGSSAAPIRGVVEGQIEDPEPRRRDAEGPRQRRRRCKTSPPTSPRSVDRPGKDTGLLATAVEAPGAGKPAVEKGGKLRSPPSPTGQLAYVTNKATATAGPVTTRNAQHVRRRPQHRARSRRRRRDRRAARCSAPARSSTKGTAIGQRDAEARHLHVLLPGPRPPRRRACTAR